MCQVYTSIIRPFIANTYLLGSFDLSVLQNLHCDAKSLFIYLFICLFNVCLFVVVFFFLFFCFFAFFLTDFIQLIRQVLEHISPNF